MGLRCRKVLGIADHTHTSICQDTEAWSRRLEGDSIIPVLHHDRDLTMNVSEQEESYHKVACFPELIFMSLCAAASQTSENTASVYEAMRLYKKTNPREKHSKKLIRGAIWANRSIFALAETTWGPECSNAFLFGKYNISDLAFMQELIASSRRICLLLCPIRGACQKAARGEH